MSKSCLKRLLCACCALLAFGAMAPPAHAVVQSIPNGDYYIVSSSNSGCWNVPWASTDPNVQIYSYPWCTIAAQPGAFLGVPDNLAHELYRFTFGAFTDYGEIYKIQPVNSLLCLASNDPGTVIAQNICLADSHRYLDYWYVEYIVCGASSPGGCGSRPRQLHPYSNYYAGLVASALDASTTPRPLDILNIYSLSSSDPRLAGDWPSYTSWWLYDKNGYLLP
jgi:hypothetical protein